MCLAIVKPATRTIPLAYLEKGWIHNPDGAGFAWNESGAVNHVKGLMTYKQFLAQYNEAVAAHKNSNFLVHFRIRSLGDRAAENTHPHILSNGAALIHNGTMDGTGATFDKGKSDTALFVEKYGDKLTYDTVVKCRSDLESALHYSANKIALLYPDGKYLIINEKTGVWDNDVWYSNHSYKPLPAMAPLTKYEQNDWD